MSSHTLFYDALFMSQNQFKILIENRKNKINIPTFVDNKAFKNYNSFYNDNNYIYPDEYNQKTEWGINESDLPEWYNTEFDQEIVEEMIDENGLFYNPKISIEEEQKIEDDYQKMKEITDSDSSDSEGEWCNVE